MPRALLVACLVLLPALSACSSNRSMMSSRPLTRALVMSRMDGWHMASREAVMFMMDKYGMPMEITETMAMWGPTGPWKRTTISSMAVQHNFPGPHPDVMEQVINYQVPTEFVDDLSMYDGSVIFERTKGELSARCDKEAANFLALNLADEIVRRQRTAQDARTKYAEQIMMMKAGQPAPYTQRLMFSPPANAMDPDQPVMPPRN